MKTKTSWSNGILVTFKVLPLESHTDLFHFKTLLTVISDLPFNGGFGFVRNEM